MAGGAKPEDRARVYLVAANQAIEEESWELAEQRLGSAIEASPAFYIPHLTLAQMHLSRGGPDGETKAIAALEQGLEAVGKTELSLLVPLASLLAKNEQHQRVEELIEPLRRVELLVTPQERGVVTGCIALVEARIDLANKTPREAVERLTPVLGLPDIQITQNRFPKVFAEIWTLFGDLRSMLGELDMATEAYRQAIRLTPRFNTLRLQLAEVAARSGNLQLAEQQLIGLRSEEADADRVFLAMANVEVQRQKRLPSRQRSWQAAQRALETARDLGAPASEVNLVAGEVMLAQGRVREAAQLVQDSLDERPSEANLWRAHSVLQQELGETETAVEASAKFLELASNRAEGAIFRAQALARAGRLDQAVEFLESELQQPGLSDDRDRVFVQLARLKLQRGGVEDATAALEAAHAEMPGSHNLADEAAGLAWLQQDWERLAEYTGWLKEIEGETGTEWRAYQAQILLAELATAEDPNFRGVIGLIQEINQARPSWPKGQYIYGELALIQGELESALASYQRAWSLGSRNILLADRIIDVLTRLNRFAEAQQYVSQASELLAYSPQLFDRAAPYYVRGAERDQALTLARSWVTANPGDADAQLRLGRVLLMLADSGGEQAKQEALQQAEAAFRKAIQVSPSDVRTWVSCVLFYDRVLNSREKALETLKGLASEVGIGQREKAFVQAQLYDRLGLLEEAQRNYVAAISEEGSEGDSAPVELLLQAARFYASKSPILSERLSMKALRGAPDSLDARVLLANSLLSRKAEDCLERVEELLGDRFADARSDYQLGLLRTHVKYLSTRGRGTDVSEAIDQLEGILEKSPEDSEQLAELYERSGRPGAAYDIYESLADRPAARTRDVANYLRFWQDEFLSASLETESPPLFEGSARQVYRVLAANPDLLGEYFRWRMREVLIREGAQALGFASLPALLDEIEGLPAYSVVSENGQLPLLAARIFSVLLQEDQPELAAKASATPLLGLSEPQLIQSLLDALLANRGEEAFASTAIQDRIRGYLRDQDAPTQLVRQAADWEFLTGNNEQAAGLYKKVVDAGQSETVVLNNLALAIGESPSERGQAKRLLRDLLKKEPNNTQLIDSLASLELLDGNASAAAEMLEPVAESTFDASVFLHLADAYRLEERLEDAVPPLERSLGLGIENLILTKQDEATLTTLKRLLPASSPGSPTLAVEASL